MQPDPVIEMKRRKERYVIIPNDNVFNSGMETESLTFFKAMHTRKSGSSLGSSPKTKILDSEVGKLKVIDSVNLNDTTLVEMSSRQAEEFERSYPTLRVQREVLLRPLKVTPMAQIKAIRMTKANAGASLQIRCKDASSGKPVVDAELVIVLDRKRQSGITDIRTDGNGEHTAILPKSAKTVDAVYCTPLSGYWPVQATDIKISNDKETVVEMDLIPIVEPHDDCLTAMLAKKPASGDGEGVKIAIIDAGTTPRAEWNVMLGMNTTDSEPEDQFHDNGSGHGTHVAGVIAKIAPKASLYLYRVFEKDAASAGEFAIAKAIRHAVDEGCDLINLSLGQTTEPISISRETRRARALGAVCIAAAGNDYGGEVNYPARSNIMVAVSALGIKGTWPKGAMTEIFVAADPAPQNDVFFATFSNFGKEIDFIGPGVGIISSVSDNEFGVMDGTSMACPAITGMFARLLSATPALLNADRDQQRSDNIVKGGHKSAEKFGFGNEYEGSGFIS